MKRFGIDVSKWQGNFNFSKAKAEGVEFVILRGAYTTGKDTKFEQYYADCKALGLPVGVYQYSMAQTVDQARKEAEFLYNNVLKGKKFEYPIYIDIEDRTQLALSHDTLTDIACAWCEYLEAKKYYVGIYAGKYTFRDQMDDSRLKRYTHWVPMWGKECTYDDKSVLGMWQFGGETNVINSIQKKVPVYDDREPQRITGYKTITAPKPIAGVVCDQNYAYHDFPAAIKANGLNGYGNTTAAAKPAGAAQSASQTGYQIGDRVKLKPGATYSNGKMIPSWVFKQTLYIRSKEYNVGLYNVSTLRIGAITGKVHKQFLTKA